MNLNYIYLIILIHSLVVFLDNYASIKIFFSLFLQKKNAAAFASRSKILFISRGFFFLIPPLLGYIIVISNQKNLKLVLILGIFITFFISLLQYFIFSKSFKFHLFKCLFNSFKKNFKNPFIYIGIFAYGLFLNTPFFVNYIASIFPIYSLSIVQLNPLLSSIATMYIVFYMDPKLSKKVDHGYSHNEEMMELIFVRLFGRLLAFLIISLFLLFG